MDFLSIFSIFLLFGSIFTAAFLRLSSLHWTILIGAVLIFITFFSQWPWSVVILSWILFLIPALFANLNDARRKYIVAPALKHLRKQLPTISATEKEAIEAGNTWWEKELFCGSPNWKTLFSMPAPRLSEAEQAFLENQVETLCGMFTDWEVLQNHDLPEPVWNYLRNEKFFGMVIPKAYGGLGFSALAHSTIVLKLATKSLSAAVNTMVPNSLGPAELLMHYGTDEQKNYYLPKLASGEEIPCFALTAPTAGSDAGAIPDTGIVTKGMYDGKETVGIRLSWDKRYITLAPVATVLGLAFNLYDPDHLLGDTYDLGITLCLLPTSHPGVEIGNRHYPVYQAFMNGPTRGKDVFIPMDWIIGGEKMAGQGWRMLMECLSIGRSISLPALATACGKMAYRNAGAYARVRRQFNTAIANFEGVEEALASIAGQLYTLEASRLFTAGAVDQNVKPAIASAIAKYHMTEMSRSVIAHAMDVHAGHMIQVGPRNYLANAHIAIPISITVEGANILTRNLIIFGQGAIRCHPYLLREVELISSPDQDIKALDDTLMQHIGFYVSNLIRSLGYGLTGGIFIKGNIKNRRIRKYQKQLTRMSTALALLSDTSLILLGGSLKRRERISARLGDIMSQLYLASAVIKYYQDHQCPDTDVDHVCWSLQQCLHKIQTAINELVQNFPYPAIVSILKSFIFPFGYAYYPPKDKLSKSIVSNMLNLNALRDRLTKHCYVSSNADDLSNRLERALQMIATVEPIMKKMRSVKNEDVPFDANDPEQTQYALKKGVINAEEAKVIQDYYDLKNEIIKVNEFSFDLKHVIA